MAGQSILRPIASAAPVGAAHGNPQILLTVLVMLMASALVAGTSLLAKALDTAALGPPLNPFQITAGRYIFCARRAFTRHRHHHPWRDHHRMERETPPAKGAMKPVQQSVA